MLLNPAVVLGLSPTGLAVARSLALKGVVVYGIDRFRWEIGHFSKWVRHDNRISYGAANDDLLRGLIAFGKEQSLKPVIIDTADAYIDFTASNHEALRESYILTDSMRTGHNSVFLNKRSFYERCKSLQIDMPTTFFPRTKSEALDVSTEIRYPAIVKPVFSHLMRKVLRGKKLVVVESPEQLIHWWVLIIKHGGEAVIQEEIVGPEKNIVVGGLYMDRNRICRSLFTGRKVRQYPPMYGSGCYMESEWLPEIAAMSVDIVTRLGYHGICGTEFKWDIRDESWKLIEVNCRPTLWFALTLASGVDVVWDAYCDLIGQPNRTNIGMQKDRVRWQLLVRDLVASMHFIRKREMSVRDLFSTTLNVCNKKEAILSWGDWSANLGYAVNSLMQWWTHL